MPQSYTHAQHLYLYHVPSRYQLMLSISRKNKDIMRMSFMLYVRIYFSLTARVIWRWDLGLKSHAKDNADVSHRIHSVLIYILPLDANIFGFSPCIILSNNIRKGKICYCRTSYRYLLWTENAMFILFCFRKWKKTRHSIESAVVHENNSIFPLL